MLVLISLRTTGPWWGEEPPSLEQALRLGALVVGQEKEGEPATTSLESEYLHRKSQCEMLIHVSSIFHMCFNVGLHSRSFVLCSDWRKSDSSVDGVPQGNSRRNSSSRDVGCLPFDRKIRLGCRKDNGKRFASLP